MYILKKHQEEMNWNSIFEGCVSASITVIFAWGCDCMVCISKIYVSLNCVLEADRNSYTIFLDLLLRKFPFVNWTQ
jgi:hypothetical protein